MKIIVNGKIFEVPDYELYSEKCGTTKYFYSNNKLPYKCDNYSTVLDAENDMMSKA